MMSEIRVARVTSGLHVSCILFVSSCLNPLFQQIWLKAHVIWFNDLQSKLFHCIFSKVLQGQFDGRHALKTRPCCAVDVTHHQIHFSCVSSSNDSGTHCRHRSLQQMFFYLPLQFLRFCVRLHLEYLSVR